MLGLVGCAAVPRDRGVAVLPPDQAGPPPEVTVELTSSGRKPLVKKLPHRPEMTVQNAIDEANTSFRYGTVKIYRPGPKGEVRMGVMYSGSKQLVEMTHNYTLHPGDRVVLEADNRTALERMLSPVLNPLSRGAEH